VRGRHEEGKRIRDDLYGAGEAADEFSVYLEKDLLSLRGDLLYDASCSQLLSPVLSCNLSSLISIIGGVKTCPYPQVPVLAHTRFSARWVRAAWERSTRRGTHAWTAL